ncbi:MAG: TetR/AcrR family transcriptional regulator [Gammaproteobacteria bacterium]
MRPPPLTRPRIVRAALRLVDDQGLPALTMRALANELDVSPMALYNHVRDKEELLDLMLDLMLGEVDCSATDGDWVTQLRTLACSFHQALSAHHHLAQVYSHQVKIGPHALSIIERTIKLLLQAGFTAHDAAAAFLTLYTYTVGRHQMGRIAPFPGATPQDQTEYFKALPADQIPSIRTASRHLGGVHGPGIFEFGLDTFLTGLQTKLTPTADHPTPAASEQEVANDLGKPAAHLERQEPGVGGTGAGDRTVSARGQRVR